MTRLSAYDGNGSGVAVEYSVSGRTINWTFYIHSGESNWQDIYFWYWLKIGSSYPVDEDGDGSYYVGSLGNARYNVDEYIDSGSWTPSEAGPSESISIEIKCGSSESGGYYNTPWANKDTSVQISASTYAITYYANNGTSSSVTKTKTHGSAYTIISSGDCGFSAPTNKEFDRWNTKDDGTGTNYSPQQSYSGNANLPLYAIWKDKGASVTLNSNNYFKDGQNLQFPNSSTKFLNSSAQLADYIPPTGFYIPEGSNDVNLQFALRGTPYHDPSQITLLGFYTEPTFTSTNVQVYEPTDPQLMRKGYRSHIYKAKAGVDGFADTLSTVTVQASDVYDTINGYETIGDLKLPIAGNNQTNFQLSLPKWTLFSGTKTWYALWSKPNLTFTYNANGGTGSYVQNIGTPGFGQDEAQSFSIKKWSDVSGSITPPEGKCFTTWTTEATQTNDNVIAPETTFQLGGYLLNTTLYAQYESSHHTIMVDYNNDNWSAANNVVLSNVTGGTSYADFTIDFSNPESKPSADATFYGLYTSRRNGKKVINADGTPANDGVYFKSNKWIYSENNGTNVTLYAHWTPDSNAYIYDEGWNPAYVYINVADPGQEPIWQP